MPRYVNFVYSGIYLLDYMLIIVRYVRHTFVDYYMHAEL